MAEANISVDQDQFTCPVCLDLLKDPVTIACGHSYCMSCISDCWDEEDQKGIYRCPLCKQTFTPRPVLVKIVQIIQTPEYEFLQHFQQFTLDPNTVHQQLHLSEGNTVITHTGTNYRYPYHQDRFDHAQALCLESVSGRCYWEVEYSGREGVHIVVAYKSIGRKGMRNDSRFGYNNQSWRLYCSNSKCSFRHNIVRTDLPVVSSRRIGVYVDHSAGILSFYSVSDTMSLIHRVQTTFTQPLYPGFGVQNDTTLKLCRLTL